MELLWTIPAIALVVAAVLLVVQLRDTAEAAADLHSSIQRIHEVRTAVADARAEAGRLQATAASLRRSA
jgi:cytochrome c-type biogenesis protein CcmH/NrfF